MSKFVLCLILTVLTLGCGGRRSASGFRLPDSGDAERGRQAFVDLRCYGCHAVEGIDLPAADANVPTVVTLGGSVLSPLAQSMTSIVAVTPGGAPGPTPIVITSPTGCQTTGTFTYQ